jgi:hypothetical protein
MAIARIMAPPMASTRSTCSPAASHPGGSGQALPATAAVVGGHDQLRETAASSLPARADPGAGAEIVPRLRPARALPSAGDR